MSLPSCLNRPKSLLINIRGFVLEILDLLIEHHKYILSNAVIQVIRVCGSHVNLCKKYTSKMGFGISQTLACSLVPGYFNQLCGWGSVLCAWKQNTCLLGILWRKNRHCIWSSYHCHWYLALNTYCLSLFMKVTNRLSNEMSCTVELPPSKSCPISASVAFWI